MRPAPEKNAFSTAVIWFQAAARLMLLHVHERLGFL
jgi:hypothetical protein